MGKLVIATHKELTEMVTSLRAENEKLRAALNCFMAMETPTQYRYSRERAEMLANDILRAAAAAIKETE